jgi:hypothetical protein
LIFSSSAQENGDNPDLGYSEIRKLQKLEKYLREKLKPKAKKKNF